MHACITHLAKVKVYTYCELTISFTTFGSLEQKKHINVYNLTTNFKKLLHKLLPECYKSFFGLD